MATKLVSVAGCILRTSEDEAANCDQIDSPNCRYCVTIDGFSNCNLFLFLFRLGISEPTKAALAFTEDKESSSQQ